MFRYSSISTAYRCLKRYQLENILGIKAEGRSADMEFGSAVHLALATYLESKSEEDAKNVFTLYWNNCSELTFGRNTWEELKDKFEVFFSRWVRLHSKKYTPKYVEKQLEFTVGKFPFQGTPDFVGEYEGIPSIVDFKTSASVYDKRKIMVNEQMPIYAHAAKQTLNYEAKQLVYVVFIKYDNRIQVVKREITQKDVDRAIDNVMNMCDDLSKRVVFPKNPESCLYCPHFERCHNE